MSQVLLYKSKLDSLINFMSARQKVIAPTPLSHGQFKFAEVSRLSDMTLDYTPTLLPPKKYFLPPQETLLQYDVSKGQEMLSVIEVENTVLFGLHTCDIAGIQCLNMVFADRPRDLHYMLRKQQFTLIGLECNDYCDNAVNCAMLFNHLPKGGYDLFLTELSDYYIVHINTHKGDQLVESSELFAPVTQTALDQLQRLRKQKKQLFKSEVPIRYQDIPKLFETTFEHQVWSEIGDKCLACGNCTSVCPTCYCFDVTDESELDLTRGRRLRIWDSCQHENFAQIAGGDNFRKKRGDRQRHRFNRKFRYPMERYKQIFCTGCGRCSRSCMANIDLKETINALLGEWGEHDAD